jgi:hypothetical protein
MSGPIDLSRGSHSRLVVFHEPREAEVHELHDTGS